MARQRHLSLTQLQEDKLKTFLEKRIASLQADNKKRISADKKSDLDYRNSKDARAQAGGVFKHNNMSVPLTSWVVDHFSARTEDEIFGRDPFSTVTPEGPMDRDTARGIDRFAAYKLFKQGKVRDDLLDSQNTQWTHRAQILKAIIHEDADEWDQDGINVLFDIETGKPVEILNHGNIIEGRDAFVPVMHPVDGPAMALKADPTFRFTPGRNYYDKSPKPLHFRDVTFRGAKSREVDSDCFLAPMTVRSFDEADALVEFYDKNLAWVQERFCDRPWINFAKFKGLLGAQSASRKTPGVRKDDSKENKDFDLEEGSYGIDEIWLERDVLGWGRPQRIVLWRERKTRELIDYEFQKMVTPSGRHPYTAIAPWKPHGAKYWWGYSIPEMMEPFQDYIDTQWNRHSFRNAINSNPIIGENPDAIAEKKRFHEMAPFDTVTLEDGKTIEDWLSAFVFPKMDLDTQDLIEKAIDWCNYWLGISDISRGDYSNVPQNTTLGGQEATLREASKLSKRWTRRIKMGYEEHIGKLLEIAIATMDEQEIFTYLEGEIEQSAWISRDFLQELKLNVKVLIGRETGVQDLQQQQMAVDLVERYFSYPPVMQQAVRTIFKQSLYMLGYDDVESLLPPPVMPMAIDPMTGLPAAPGAPAAPAPPMAPPAPGMAPGAPPPEVAGGAEGGTVLPFQQAAAAVGQ